MPTYEYGCTNCKRRFEVVQSFSDDPLSVCEVCGGTLKRIFHPVGIVLKGSGFYATDNRSSKSLTAGGKSGESSGEKSSGETSGEKTSGEKTSEKPAKKDGSSAKESSSSSGSKGSDAAAS